MEAKNCQHKLAEESKTKDDFIETILQNLPIGIAVNKIDDGKTIIVNKCFIETYECSNKDLKDIRSFFRKVYPDDVCQNEVANKGGTNDGQNGDPEWVSWNSVSIKTQTHENRVVNSKSIPMYDKNLMISTVLDVTNEFNRANEIKRIKANQEALINTTQDMMWSVDSNLYIIAANDSFVKMIKMLTGNIIKEGDCALIKEFGEEHLVKWKVFYQQVLNGEQITVKDQYYNPIKKKLEYSQISLSPVFNDKNEIFGVACCSKDITSETLNRLALENAQIELQKIMSSSLDILCSVDAQGYILSISAAVETILGYNPQELIGKALSDFVCFEGLEKTEWPIGTVTEGHDILNLKKRFLHKNGSLVSLIWTTRWDPKDKIKYYVARDATESEKREAALVESEKKYKYLFENIPCPILIWDFETLRIIDCNQEAIIKYGYTKDEFLQLTINDIRPPEDMNLFEDIIETEESFERIRERIWRHKKKNGEIMFVDISKLLINYNGRKVVLVIANDVTEIRYYYEVDKLEKHVLELNARDDKRLEETIRIYLSGIESLHPGMLCSMQVLRGSRLYNLAAPSLPEKYLKVVEGVEIGNNVCSCGTASFLKEKVIVTDISNDIRWAAYKEVAGQYQLKTCWSYPILDGKNDVAATFACYYRKIKTPTEREEYTIQRAGHILQVILNSYKREHDLKISNERFGYATEATSDIIWDWNLETNSVYYSGNMQKLFGHMPDAYDDNLPFYFEHVHPDDRGRVILDFDQVKHGTMINWTQEYRFKKANGGYAFVLNRGIVIRDENGVGTRMIGAMQDITMLKQNELRIIQQNEQLNEIALINAHQIRRPVANILGLMELFNAEIEVHEVGMDIMNHLNAETKELDAVIRRIIDKTVA